VDVPCRRISSGEPREGDSWDASIKKLPLEKQSPSGWPGRRGGEVNQIEAIDYHELRLDRKISGLATDWDYGISSAASFEGLDN
jgi:hypothetical protein